MKWIIFIAILVMAIAIYSNIKKKNQKKKRAFEKAERKKERQETTRQIDIFNKRLSVNKKRLPDEEVTAVAKFEYDWSEESPYFYSLQNEKKEALEIIRIFLISRRKILENVKHAISHDEIKSYSRLFLQSFMGKATEGKKIDNIINIWVDLFSVNYERREVNREAQADFDLFSEMILEDLKNINDSEALSKKIDDITLHFTSTYLRYKLRSSDQYRNVLLETKKRRKEKLLAELEAFKSKGVIDKEFISYVKNHQDEKEQFIIREAFDEIAFKEVMNKFFPGQNYSKIKPEFLTVLAQAYSGLTLKLLE